MSAEAAKPSLLIHIGHHKTATTWLQRELFTARSGVFEPVTADGNVKYFGNRLVHDEAGYLRSVYDDRAEDVKREAASWNWSVLGDRVGVISNERLSGNPLSGGFDGPVIAARIRHCFPEARILCVVREQRSALLSIYFQYLKAGGTSGLDVFVHSGKDRRRPCFLPDYLDYTRIVGLYRRLFGAERVCVLPYEMFVAEPTAYVARICAFAGAKQGAAVRMEARHNRGASRAFQVAMRWMNLLTRKNSLNGMSPLYLGVVGEGLNQVMRYAADRVRINRLEAALIGRMQKKIAAFVGDRYEASNKQLAEITGMDLEKYGYGMKH